MSRVRRAAWWRFTSVRVARSAARTVLALVLAVCSALAVAPACAPVRLVAAYDEQVDRTATRLQREMDAFLTEAERLPAGASYTVSEPFYTRYAVDLRALKVRATALQRNSVTVEQIGLLESSLEQLRRLHQSQGTLSPAALATSRDLFNTAWTAILTFELAKKR